MKQALSQGHHSGEDAYLAGLPDHGHLDIKGAERNFRLQLFKSRLADMYSTDVIANDELVRIAADLRVFNRLEGEDVEEQLAILQQTAGALVTRRKPVTLIDRF